MSVTYVLRRVRKRPDVELWLWHWLQRRGLAMRGEDECWNLIWDNVLGIFSMTI
jgi:hypothetical protein